MQDVVASGEAEMINKWVPRRPPLRALRCVARMPAERLPVLPPEIRCPKGVAMQRQTIDSSA
jgi:hypothetical protein